MPAEFDYGDYVDDPSIPDDATVFRRVKPGEIIWDGNKEDYRASSVFLTDGADNDPMSVYLAPLLSSRELEARHIVGEEHAGYWVAVIPVAVLREQRQRIVRDEVPDEAPCGFAHALIVGPRNGKRRKRIAKSAEWAYRGPDPPKRPEPEL